jgi:hypothetical protein
VIQAGFRSREHPNVTTTAGYLNVKGPLLYELIEQKPPLAL